MTLPRARVDSDPEFNHYPDNGCPDLGIPSCLSCPLPRCRYDVAGGARAMTNKARDRAIVRLRLAGESIDQLAADFNVGRRTAFRALQDAGVTS